jgi:hypothetical protein
MAMYFVYEVSVSFTSPPKEVVLRLLSPLKSVILDRVWTHESWVQYQAR